jgi:hypothetical protein
LPEEKKKKRPQLIIGQFGDWRLKRNETVSDRSFVRCSSAITRLALAVVYGRALLMVPVVLPSVQVRLYVSMLGDIGAPAWRFNDARESSCRDLAIVIPRRARRCMAGEWAVGSGGSLWQCVSSSFSAKRNSNRRRIDDHPNEERIASYIARIVVRASDRPMRLVSALQHCATITSHQDPRLERSCLAGPDG